METSTPIQSTDPSSLDAVTNNGYRQDAVNAPPLESDAPPNSVEEPSSVTPQPHPKRQKFFIGLLGIGILTIGGFGYRWWHYASTHQATDDAYVAANIHPINARVSGTVKAVLVDDNQEVTQGEPLVKLDPRDYQVALQQAQAALATAQQQALVAQANIGVTSTNAQGQTTQAQGNIAAASAAIATAQAQVAEAQAGVPAAQDQLSQVNADLIKAQNDYERYQYLAQQGAVPQQQFDAVRATYETTLAQRDAAKEQVKQAQDRVTQAQNNLANAQAQLAATRGNLEEANATRQQTVVQQRQYQAALASVAQAEANVQNAQLQLAYTNITAPDAGQIGNKTVQVGQQVQPGQTLMSLIQKSPWVIANFKETQLEHIHVGQEVEINLDAFPDHSFKGRVESLSPASGSEFALLPPDNATGNFTKVVQRIPIKIVFDEASIQGYKARINPGMSATITVKTD